MSRLELWYSPTQQADGRQLLLRQGFSHPTGHGVAVRLDTSEQIFFTQTNEVGLAAAPNGQQVRQELGHRPPYSDAFYYGDFNGPWLDRVAIITNLDGTTRLHTIGRGHIMTAADAETVERLCERFHLRTSIAPATKVKPSATLLDHHVVFGLTPGHARYG